MIAKFLAALLAASSILAGAGALAADSPPAAPAPAPAASPDGYIVTLQAIGAVAPSFPGSAVVRPYPFPGFSVRGIGEPERFSAPDDGFGVPVFEADGLRMGPVANFVFRRGNRDGLSGLHQVGLTHEVGGFAEYFAFDHFRARAELRQAVDGHDGFVASLGADFYGESNSFRLSLGPRLNLGDNRYANAYFSVTPVEAILNGRLEPYQANGGFTSAGGVATIRYDFTPNLNAT
ncbi:MAG: MipA/OmpV family protein, partial [Rhodoblastus sp.]|uniref:MipA/OmpV family protein n=1 Tax=Rhodoblastus sp. TaxID=1962975 RepID=UPI003F95019E